MNQQNTDKEISTRSRRGRLPRAVVAVVVVLVALLAWLGSGWRTVPDGALGLLESRLRDDAVLEPGGHLTLPGLESLRILDPFGREAALAWRSPEGASLDLSYAFDLRLTADGARRLLQRGDGPDLGARLDSGADRVVLDVVDRMPRKDALPDLGAGAAAALAAALSSFGTVEGSPRIGYAEDSPVVLAMRREQARRELLDRSTETGVKILIVGLDGADWQIADPLIERGLLPNLASLKRRGSWSNIKALTPILSPLIWTSIASGVTADRHGVLDFLVKDSRTGAKVPVNSRFRKVRALWNIFSEADRTVDFVAWWATWPAEPINGHMISDRVSYSLFDVSLPAEGAGTTHPPGYLEQIRGELIGDDAITYDEVARFADVSEAEFRAERASIEVDRNAAYQRPLNHLTKILASTRNYHRITLDLLSRRQPDLLAVYYQGIDEVGHRFMHFAPPRMPGVEEEDVRRYGAVVENFYLYQDELLGELLSTVSDDTTVIVLSDHGFLNGPDRPTGQTADIEGQPARWHRKYGMLILAGPPIAAGRLDTTSMLDITPTVLRLAGLPVADDMEGRVLEEALRPGFADRFPGTRIATYESTPLRIEAEPLSQAMAAVEAEVMENLRALGYIGGGGDAPEEPAGAGDDADLELAEADAGSITVTGHTNLAGVLLSSGDLEGAEREILAALELAPRFVTARRQLFDLRLRQDRFDDAIAVAHDLIADGKNLDSRFLARVAEAYEGAGRREEGVRRFRLAVQGGQWQLGVPLSRLLLDAGDANAAERAARDVLEADPVNEAAMATLLLVAREMGRPASPEPLIRRALEVNPRSVLHLNWLAVVEESKGDMPSAERLLRRALEVDPDHGGAQANLGAFFVRHGRVADAISLLERALRIEPANVEARVNLGTAHASMGRLDQAIPHFERAVEYGCRDVTVYNALARAYFEQDDVDASIGWLRRSLEIDPAQPAICDTLNQLENR